MGLKRWFKKNKFKLEFGFTVNAIFAFQFLFLAVFVVGVYEFWNGSPGIYLIYAIIGLIMSFKSYELRLFYKKSFIQTISDAMEKLKMDGVPRRTRRKINSKLKKVLRSKVN